MWPKYDGLCVYVQRDIKLREVCLYGNMYQDSVLILLVHGIYGISTVAIAAVNTNVNASSIVARSLAFYMIWS